MKNVIEKIKNNKNMALIGAIIVLVIVVLIVITMIVTNLGENKNNNKPETKVVKNTNEKVVSDVTVADFEISKVSVTIEDGITNYRAVATNVSDEAKAIKGFKIYPIAEDETNIGEITIYITTEVEKGDSIELINYSDIDFTKAVDMKYEAIYE